MTRIIGGEHRGRRLRTPPGSGTRPTSDRVREALFSALEARLGSLRGLRFLDLYAGSGAVGLEAGSRGAGEVTAVESDRRTARLVAENARAIGVPLQVVAQPVSVALATRPPAPYDVVFLDPPYPLGEPELAADLLALVRNGWVGPGSEVIVERSRRSVEPTWPPGLREARMRSYGESVLWYVSGDPEVEPGEPA